MYQLAGTLSVILVLVGVARYIAAICSGAAVPSRATWWVFTAVSILILASALASSQPSPSRWQLWVFAATGLPIAVLALFRGQPGFGVYDKACTGVALAAVVFWICL